MIASTDPSSATTLTSYDVFGNVLDVTDPLGNQTVYNYNRLNQPVTEGKVYGSGTENRSYSYDGAGNLRSLTDRNDRLTEWDYDNRYRVTSETWKTGLMTDRTFTYAYDTSDRTVSVTDSDPLATDFEFAYDDRSQLLAERQLTGLVGTSVVLDRRFDGNGNRITLGANFGGILSGSSIMGGIDDFNREFAYDGLNRLTSVNSSSVSGGHAVAPKLATFEYNAASQRTDLRRYSATTASASDLEIHSRRGYDQAGRLTGITHGTAEIAAGQIWDGTSSLPASLGATDMLAGYFFGYDQDNRLVDFSSYRDGTKTSYGYDSRDQLTLASTAAISGLSQPFGLASSESYDFDAGGNRKSSGGSSQSAAGTHNQLQTDGTYDYTYDDEGNTLSKTSIATGEVTEYGWDQRNRLVLVTERTSAGGTITQQVKFIYDAFDQRVGKRVDTNGDGFWDRDEAFVWADGQTVLRLEDSDGVGIIDLFRVANRYLYGDAVDEILADEQYTDGSGPAVNFGTASTTAGETLWTIADHLGSVRDLVDNNGTVREHVVFDSFGNRLVDQDYDASGSAISSSHADAVDTLFGYTGRDWDADVELQNNRARWYDPTTGRWLSQDPIGFAAGDVNLYRYVGNQATGATDPSGLEEQPGQFPGKPKGTIGRDILQDLHREDAALRPIIEHQHNIRQQNKRDIGEAGQRMMADMGGFGVVIDGAEAISGHNLLSTECETLTTWQRLKSGAWAIIGMLPFFGHSDDSVRALRDRVRVLGTDPRRGFIIAEGMGGVRIERALGRSIRRSADEAIDFVDDLLGPISLKGPIPCNASPQGLAAAAIKDARFNTATKVLFVDLRGLSVVDNALVRKLVIEGTTGVTKIIHFLD
ncbi:MAG: RHS repeat-associated core domain-containing protein [Pirellulaceae bacterium]